MLPRETHILAACKAWLIAAVLWPTLAIAQAPPPAAAPPPMTPEQQVQRLNVVIQKLDAEFQTTRISNINCQTDKTLLDAEVTRLNGEIAKRDKQIADLQKQVDAAAPKSEETK